MEVSARDARILALVAAKQPADFAAAVDALREATEAVIPNGRVYFLGQSASGPIVGSLISGVGITPAPGGFAVVRR